MTKRIVGMGGYGVYHCMSRTVHGGMLLGDREKEVFRRMLWRVAEFSGVRVYTYCLMDNHFHVLLEVDREAEACSDAELIRRYRILYHEKSAYRPMGWRQLQELFERGDAEAERWRAWLRRRMGDVSEFMRTLKLRYSRWYNETHGTFGALWAERFKSVLVEGQRFALQTVAAYIDLNPVRAGLVEDPKDYRFCGYGEAMGGQRRAQAGVDALMVNAGRNGGARLAAYRQLLFGKGAAGKAKLASIPSVSQGAEMPLSMLLRCRLRFLTEGGIIGSQGFVADQGQGLVGRRRVNPRTVGEGALEVLSALRQARSK